MRPLLPLLALVSACGSAYEPDGKPVDFDLYVPSVEEGADTAEVLMAEPVDEEASEPLLDPGIYQMYVEDLEGESCRSGLEEGGTVEVLVEPVEGGARVMDLVTIAPTEGSRAWGVSSQSIELGDGCMLDVSVFASANLHGERAFEARFEMVRTLSGEGCEALSKLPEPCHGAWEAGLAWSRAIAEEPRQ